MPSFNLPNKMTYITQETVYESEENKTAFYKALEVQTGRVVGIKKISASKKYFNAYTSEIKVLIKLEQTANVPVVYQYFTERSKNPQQDDRIYIIMQYIKGQTLEKALENDRHSLLEKETTVAMLKRLKKLAEVLSDVHNSNSGGARYIQHKDLKPANIIIGKKNHKEELYLIDFGLSASGSVKGRGTKGYQSPEQHEMFSLTSDGSRIDVFVFGLIMYEVLCGKKLEFFKDLMLDTKTNKWKNIPKITDINQNVCREADNLLASCIAYNPRERLNDGGKILWQMSEILRKMNIRE